MARKLVVEIVGDARSLDKAFKKSSKHAKDFGGDMSKTGRAGKKAFGGLGRGVGLLTGAIGVAGLAGAVKAFAGEALEAQKVSAQTAAAIKSTGGAANVTARDVDALADAMLKKTGIDDEAIKTSENMLLSFTRIRNQTGKNNKIFDRATLAVADLATAMNKGSTPSADQMQKASVQLGKALNDPVKGIGALSRVGIQFTEQQKKQIKTMVATGDTLGAQKVILAEVNKEFGGRSVAAGKTFAGQWNIMRETIMNLGGAIAEQLMPAVSELLGELVKWLNNSKNQKAVMDTVKTAVEVLTGVIKTLKGAFDLLAGAVGGSKNALKILIGVFVAWKVAKLVGTIGRLAGNFGLLGTKMGGATGNARNLSGAMGKVGVAGAVGLAAYELSNMIRKIPGWDKKMMAFGGTIADVATKLGLIKDPMAEFKGKIVPGVANIRALRREAAGIRGTPQQRADILARRHPNYAKRDIEVAVGARRPVNVTVNQHFNRPTPDRHREARRARQAMKAAFDG